VGCLYADDAHLASQAMPDFYVGYHLTTARTPTGFAEIVSDDFPILHAVRFGFFCSPRGNEKMISADAMLRATFTIAVAFLYATAAAKQL
jgi:hypothetical protein